MNNKFLVSAIVSTYNSERFIRGKIEDLLKQSLGDRLEIVIVNSGSKQNEEAIIREYTNKYSLIKYIKTEERESVYRAWNRGIRMASGEFIANSNTDDRLRYDCYEVLSNILVNNPQYALVYANQLLTTVENQKFEDAKGNKIIRFPDYTHLKQLERCIIGSQPMWRAHINKVDDIWFDEKFEVCGDHDFELRVSERYKIYHLNEVLGTFYKSPTKSNIETKNPDGTTREVLEVTTTYVHKFVNDNSKETLDAILEQYKINISVPIIFYELIKRVDKFLFPGIYPRFFFHSIEFIYYLNIIILEKNDELEKIKKLCKKYLKYKKSVRIQNKYAHLSGGGK